jgi:hypothetical protein
MDDRGAVVVARRPRLQARAGRRRIADAWPGDGQQLIAIAHALLELEPS